MKKYLIALVCSSFVITPIQTALIHPLIGATVTPLLGVVSGYAMSKSLHYNPGLQCDIYHHHLPSCSEGGSIPLFYAGLFASFIVTLGLVPFVARKSVDSGIQRKKKLANVALIVDWICGSGTIYLLQDKNPRLAFMAKTITSASALYISNTLQEHELF